MSIITYFEIIMPKCLLFDEYKTEKINYDIGLTRPSSRQPRRIMLRSVYT
jgi:hypothetical protein